MSVEKISQEQFLKVKERLDYYRLPTNFPFEATPLLNRLLSLVDAPSSQPQNHQALLPPEQISAALKYQIGQLVKENNQLHMNLIVAKQQIQSLEHRLFKGQATKHSQLRELQTFSSLKMKREQELIGEIQQAKYKYNELMDFLHEDPSVEKEYIKRLLKHKHAEVAADGPVEEAVRGGGPVSSTQDRVRELETKIANREQEIRRLQRAIQYDGVNLNKILKNFNEDLAKKQLNSAASKIQQLQESYDKVKKENKSIKSKNGSKEALRAEVENCHKIIESLKKQNKELKRSHREQNFDIQKKEFENQRKIGKVQSQNINAGIQLGQKELLISDLKHKVTFLEQQLQQSKTQAQTAADRIAQSEEHNLSLIRKNEETKVFYEYEMEQFRKKLEEVEVERQQVWNIRKGLLAEIEVKNRQNELKTQAILNLEKIVNQLIRKNSALPDHTAGTLEESLKNSAELEFRNRLADLDRELNLTQRQKAELQINLRSLESRLERAVTEHERARYENGILRNDLRASEGEILKLKNDLNELRHLYKKEEGQRNRIAVLLQEKTKENDVRIAQLSQEKEKLSQQEKSLKLRLRDLEIKISEEEGVWEVTRRRLEDKDSKIQQLEKLLAQTVERNKELIHQAGELERQNHELTRQNHRVAKKCEQLAKDEQHFKATSFKNYENAISENLNEVTALRKELAKLSEAYEGLSIQNEDVNNLLAVIQREKELLEFDKISLGRQSELLRTRLIEMQQIERALVLENESLRSLTRKI